MKKIIAIIPCIMLFACDSGVNTTSKEVVYKCGNQTFNSVTVGEQKDCLKIAANNEQDFLKFKALGHEPEWSFVFESGSIKFRTVDEKTTFAVPEISTGTSSLIKGGMTLTIEQKVCQDTMSGQFHLYTVQVKIEENVYNGCGFSLSDPNQSLLPI